VGTYAGVLASLLSPPFILLCSSFLVFHFLFFLFVCLFRSSCTYRDETSEIRCGSSTRLDTLSGLALRLFAVVRLKPGLVEVCQPEANRETTMTPNLHAMLRFLVFEKVRGEK
jgi:hypothetical protein